MIYFQKQLNNIICKKQGIFNHNFLHIKRGNYVITEYYY